MKPGSSHLNLARRSPPLHKGGKANSTSGFTLIELLIVIVIISIVASFAVLSINFNQNKRLESLSNQLVNTLTLAEQEALLRTTTLGFSLTQNTFQFYEYHALKDPEKSPWQPLNDNILGLHHIPKDVQMTLKIEGKSVSTTQPKLIISPSGDITPFIIYVGKKDNPPHYKVRGEANGTIKSEMINEE